MSGPFRAGASLPAGEYARVRRRAMFEWCKWDPQVADTPSLADFPLILSAAAWRELAGSAERLAAETLAAEHELAALPVLHRRLGLSRALRTALQAGASSADPRQGPPSDPRIMRFDFHFTTEGWRISEVNSDVPGGFIEASAFTRRFADFEPGTTPAGDPAAAYADAVHGRIESGLPVALVHATAYVDDRQVMIYLAREFAQRARETVLASPADLSWRDGVAWVATPSGRVPVGGMVRFFPAEWLPNLGPRQGWQRWFGRATTPLSNPGTAILTQSKRFPLVWEQLATPLPEWHAALPRTVDPRTVPWRRDEQWVLKPALGRVGEAIGLRGVTGAKEWQAIRRDAWWWPGHWVAQQRFEAVPVAHRGESWFPVLGVYVIDGQAAGIYGRLARRPLVDYQAQDVAVLVECDRNERQTPGEHR